MRTRHIIHRLHLWAGLVLCLPLVMMGITGSILVAAQEWEQARFASAAQAGGAVHQAGEIIEAAVRFAPSGFSPVMLRMGMQERAPVGVWLKPRKRETSGGARMQIRIDPVTLAVLPANGSENAIRWIHDLHSHLLLREYGGRSVVGWLGVFMFAFGVSGIALWWPRKGRWKHAFSVRFHAGKYRMLRELHAVAGIASVSVLMMVSASGVYLVFPQVCDGIIGSMSPLRDLKASPVVEKGEPGSSALSVDEAMYLAREAVPEGRSVSVLLPSAPTQPYRVGMARGDDREGAPMVNIFVDPWKKRVIEVRDPERYFAGETFVAWQHTLHMGQGWGMFWELGVFAIGLMPALFAYTGISMWLYKRKNRRTGGSRLDSTPVVQ